MRVLGKERIHEAIAKHADAGPRLRAWLAEAEDAKWTSSRDVKRRYPSVSFLGGNRVIFNIGGNNYRLVASAAYNTDTVLVEWFGTHAQYSKKRF
ncbi:MAG: type II toxin-antitoxin system HigB family toxin [Candidatus Eisenbacteria sp.]|nr:type II toxin-antitoxin system HigB family toxin [Candidatus Eisenbacteria bacterium]